MPMYSFLLHCLNALFIHRFISDSQLQATNVQHTVIVIIVEDLINLK